MAVSVKKKPAILKKATCSSALNYDSQTLIDRVKATKIFILFVVLSWEVTYLSVIVINLRSEEENSIKAKPGLSQDNISRTKFNYSHRSFKYRRKIFLPASDIESQCVICSSK